MKLARTYACAICGVPRAEHEHWFLVANNRWQDKLRILQWNDRLAREPGIFHACTAEHVQELVVHWMTTGSLDYPFARVPKLGRHSLHHRGRLMAAESSPHSEVDTRGARQIGELSVHRESMQRVLSESPHSLTEILEALLSALRRTSPPPKPKPAAVDECWVLTQEV